MMSGFIEGEVDLLLSAGSPWWCLMLAGLCAMEACEWGELL